jgi:protein TonB
MKMSVNLVLEPPVRREILLQPAQKLQIVNRPITTAPPTSWKGMFEDVLLETSSGQRRQKTWTVIVSVGMQCILVSLVILAPLWYTEVLPQQELATMLTIPPPPPPAPPPSPASAAPKSVASTVVNGRLTAPSMIPSQILMVKEAEASPSDGVIGGVIGGMPGGELGGVLGGIFPANSHPVVVRGPSNAPPQRVRLSQGVTEGMIISKVPPVYPAIARAARTEGVVVLQATIDEDGDVQRLTVVSGPALLRLAAIDAVSQWHYRPYLLSGQPVEVDATVQVIFQIGH